MKNDAETELIDVFLHLLPVSLNFQAPCFLCFNHYSGLTTQLADSANCPGEQQTRNYYLYPSSAV